MRKIKLNKDTEMTVDVIKYVLDIHKEELLENWRLLSNFELANKIEPLK